MQFEEPHGHASSVETHPDVRVCDYELVRRANIKRNALALASFGIMEAKQSVDNVMELAGDAASRKGGTSPDRVRARVPLRRSAKSICTRELRRQLHAQEVECSSTSECESADLDDNYYNGHDSDSDIDEHD